MRKQVVLENVWESKNGMWKIVEVYIDINSYHVKIEKKLKKEKRYSLLSKPKTSEDYVLIDRFPVDEKNVELSGWGVPKYVINKAEEIIKKEKGIK